MNEISIRLPVTVWEVNKSLLYLKASNDAHAIYLFLFSIICLACCEIVISQRAVFIYYDVGSV